MGQPVDICTLSGYKMRQVSVKTSKEDIEVTKEAIKMETLSLLRVSIVHLL